MTRFKLSFLAGLLALWPALASAQVHIVPNAGTTGTATGQIAKVTGAPSTAVRVGTADTTWNGIVVGETTTTATTGSALLQVAGQANCTFDGATTAGDFVQISGTTAGDCHDAGATFPTSGSQVVGQVLSTNGAGGSYTINVFSPGIPAGGGAAGLTALTQDVIASGSGSQPASVVGGTSVFCTGADGNIAGGAGTTTLTKDTCYNNVTLSGSDQIVTAGYRLFVAGTLDISAAPSNAIIVYTSAQRTGNAAVAGTGGTNLPVVLGSLPNCTPNSINTLTLGTGAGANGVTGLGGGGTSISQATSSPNQGFYYGGRSTVGAIGGVGASGAGTGAATALASLVVSLPTPYVTTNFTAGPFQGNYWAAQSGPGGGSGGGDGTHISGSGGGGAYCGGFLAIYARTIARGTNTNPSIISAIGGTGGVGSNANASCTNCGGGAGGGGGGGGHIYLVYENITGSAITNALDASSGAGGNAGNGVGTGANGNGGSSGGSGAIEVIATNAGTYTATAPGTTFNAGSGATGGASKTAQQNL